MKPVIAITPESITLPQRWDGHGSFCGVSYSQAVELAGGVPLIVPLTNEHAMLDHFLKTCDGWLFSGGGDVCGKFYGLPKAKEKLIKDADPVRDEMEIYLLRKLAKKDVPTLGVCRGIQVMNVAFGGTLLPDIQGHRNPQPDARAHTIQWQGRALGVNTSHHQAVDRVATGFAVTARAPDGIVEAMEKTGARFFRGVQFHPERMVKVEPACLRIFEELVGAVTNSRRRLSGAAGV